LCWFRQAAVAISGGSIGRALDALAAESTEVSGETAASLMASLRKAASSRAAIPMLDAAAQFSGTKEDRARLSEVLTRLSHYYRDVMVTAAGAEELIVLRAQSDEIAALAATTGGSSLPVTKALNALFEAQSALDGNVSPALLTEVLLFRLAALESRVPRSV
jgi:hypothetical protein